MTTKYEVGSNVLIKGKVDSIKISKSGAITYTLTGISSVVSEDDIVSEAEPDAGMDGSEDIVDGEGSGLSGI